LENIGSWDSDRVVQCDPKEYGGYPKERTTYTESTLRTLNMLVETSNKKTPVSSQLGTNEDVFNAETKGNGHISRNIRLSLLAVELVQPYVSILSVNDVELTDDIVPSSARDAVSCMRNNQILVPYNKKSAVITWTVGGGFTVDETFLVHAKMCNFNGMDEILRPFDVETNFEKTETLSGATRWDESVSGSDFDATIDTSNYSVGDKLIIYAVAKLDKSWGTQPDNVKPDVPPMSHVVNARTNVDWRHESEGKIIQGQRDWYSLPITLIMVEPEDVDEATVELYKHGDLRMEYHDEEPPSQDTKMDRSAAGLVLIGIVLTVVSFSLLILSCLMMFVLRSRRKVKFESVKSENTDEKNEVANEYSYEIDSASVQLSELS